MTYISTYTVAITYRWKSAFNLRYRHQTVTVSIDAHNREVAIARAMMDLMPHTDIYVTEVEVTDQSDGWYEYE